MTERPRLPQAPGQVLVRVAASVGQAVKGLGFFKRRQVLALQVLDQRELDHLGIVDLADHDRQLAQPDLHRCLVAALAGDDLEALAAGPHDQRLDDRPSRQSRQSAPTGRP